MLDYEGKSLANFTRAKLKSSTVQPQFNYVNDECLVCTN